MLSKNAVGNLMARYKAVLRKCYVLNTFGSVVCVTMLSAGGLSVSVEAQALPAPAGEVSLNSIQPGEMSLSALTAALEGSPLVLIKPTPVQTPVTTPQANVEQSATKPRSVANTSPKVTEYRALVSKSHNTTGTNADLALGSVVLDDPLFFIEKQPEDTLVTASTQYDINDPFPPAKLSVESAQSGLSSGSASLDRSGNSAVRIGLLGGAELSTINAAWSNTKALVARNSDAGFKATKKSGATSTGMEGLGVWATPLYTWSTTSEHKTGGYRAGNDMGLGGIAVGVDYTVNDVFRFGMALNTGFGHVQSNGGLFTANNDFEFWGISLYAAYRENNFGITADLGYLDTVGDIHQNTDAGKAKAETHTSAFTAGLKLDYTFNIENFNITPYVGVRYMGLTNASYNVRSSGSTWFHVAEENQEIWYFPLGVAFSADIPINKEWMFTPKLDLGVILATGDLEANSKATIPGGVFDPISSSLKNVDDVAFNGSLGFEVSNDVAKLGLTYNLLASEHEVGHMVMGSFIYEF